MSATTWDGSNTIAGYEIKEMASGVLVLSVGDNEDGEADEALEQIRSELPAGWTAEFAGEGNTSGGGDTTTDVHLAGPCHSCHHGDPYGHEAGHSCYEELDLATTGRAP